MVDSAAKLGRYVVLDELAGREGERTLVAFDPELDRKVGLKLFPAASDGAQARRRDRARVLAGIVHPHVVRLHDVGTVDGRLFAAMDFVEGSTIGPWIEREQPPWRRVMEVFLAAAEGLAAAHAAGLVHGDFSGHSVVVGDDGQIRVIDFVRSTPQLGSPPDEAGDRRDWCRALFEALYGRPPGDPVELPSTPKLPRRVRRALEDGLRDGARVGSMRALIEELRAGLGRRRELGVAAVLLAAASIPAILWRSDAPPPAASPWCEGIEERLARTWNEDVAGQVHAAFLATELPYAEDTWASVRRDVDAFVDDWHRAQRAHCEAAPDGTDAPGNVATTVCLHRQFQALHTLVEALQAADVELVTTANAAIASLGSPTACGIEGPEEEARFAGVELEQVLEVEAILSEATVLSELGRFAESLEAAQQARERAKALGLRSLIGRAEYRVAEAQADLGQEKDAERGYHEAFSSAVASGDPELVVRSAMELAALLAEQGRHDEARRWVDHAAAAIERHDTLALRTRLEAVRGLTAYRAGRNEEAREHYEASIALAQRSDPPDAYAKMHASQALGNVLGRLGSTEEEIELLREGLALAEATLGPDHPVVGHHLNSLGGALSQRGSVDLALDVERRAVAIFEASFGRDHANTIAARTSLAATLQETGHDDEAAQTYAEALAAAKRTFAESDPRYVTTLGNVGMFYSLQGRSVEAAALLAEAAARNEAIHGPAHIHTLGYLTNLAATHMFAGNLEEAGRVYEQVLGRTEAALGAEHPQLVAVLLGLSRVRLEQHRPADAVGPLERALTLSIAKAVRPERIATVRFDLAQALWDAEIDRPRALALAREAAQDFVAARDGGWDIGDRLDEVQAWIAERSGEPRG